MTTSIHIWRPCCFLTCTARPARRLACWPHFYLGMREINCRLGYEIPFPSIRRPLAKDGAGHGNRPHTFELGRATLVPCARPKSCILLYMVGQTKGHVLEMLFYIISGLLLNILLFNFSSNLGESRSVSSIAVSRVTKDVPSCR